MKEFEDFDNYQTKDDLIDLKTDEDLYFEHQFHDTPISHCSICFTDELHAPVEEDDWELSNCCGHYVIDGRCMDCQEMVK